MTKRTSRRTSKRTSKRTSQQLVPNAPIDRLAFVRKTYGATQPWVVLDTLSVIFNTIGIDNAEEEIWQTVRQDRIDNPTGRTARALTGHDGTLHPGLSTIEELSRYTLLTGMIYSEALRATWLYVPDEQTSRRKLEALLKIVDLPSFADGAMREPSEADGIFPWVARELSKQAKSVLVGQGDGYTDYEDALFTLRARTNAIAAWAKAKRVDIMKMSLDEVLEASKDYRYGGKVRQGKVIYRFPTGWTVQELRGRRELEPEGKALSHCVGKYAGAVERGESVIYSLRDPDGVPYVTMEWQPWKKGDPPSSDRWGSGVFAQIFGHGNSNIGSHEFCEYVLSAGQDNNPALTTAQVPEVTELIQAMVVEFIDKTKDGSPTGLVLAGASLNGRDLRGAHLRYANLSFADLQGVDMSGAFLNTANLQGANLQGANLESASLWGAHLQGANLQGANLRNANLRSSVMARMAARGADFSRADMRSAYLHDANLEGANVDGARTNGGTVWPVEFEEPRDSAAGMLSGFVSRRDSS